MRTTSRARCAAVMMMSNFTSSDDAAPVETAVGRIQRFTQHDASCDWWLWRIEGYEARCTCGLDDALAKLRRPTWFERAQRLTLYGVLGFLLLCAFFFGATGWLMSDFYRAVKGVP